jgi:polysaccharide deacetylase 2 family uncharacterized protein YibQ
LALSQQSAQRQSHWKDDADVKKDKIESKLAKLDKLIPDDESMGGISSASQQIIRELMRQLAERDKDDGKSSRSSASRSSKYSHCSVSSQQIIAMKDRENEELRRELIRANAKLEAQPEIDRVAEANR